MVTVLSDTLAEGLLQSLLSSFTGGFMLTIIVLTIFLVFYLRFNLPIQVILFPLFVLLYKYYDLFNLPSSFMYIVSLLFFLMSAYIMLRLMIALMNGVLR